MKKENLIIIGAIIIVLICAITALLFVSTNKPMEYTTLQVSDSCSLQVPVSNNVENATDNYGIFYYVDKEHNLNITSFNSQDGVTLSGAVQMASLRDTQQLNSQVVIENGTSLYYNKDTGVYTIFLGNDTSHDNILISTPDKDLLLTIVNSVNYLKNIQNNDSGEDNVDNNGDSSTSNGGSSASNSKSTRDSPTSDGYEYSQQYDQEVKQVNDGIVDRENNYLVQERNGHFYDSEGYQID